MEGTNIIRFRESASRMPEPVEVSIRPIPGQETFPLAAAGYREADAVWLRQMLATHGHNGEG